MKPCPKCEQQNPDDAHFCGQCGAPFPSVEPSPLMTDDELWRAFIGPNADRYLAQFKKFNFTGAPRYNLTWHWPAFLFIPFLWFLYRKMYLYAFVYAVGPAVSTSTLMRVSVFAGRSVLTGSFCLSMARLSAPGSGCRVGSAGAGRRGRASEPGTRPQAGPESRLSVTCYVPCRLCRNERPIDGVKYSLAESGERKRGRAARVRGFAAHASAGATSRSIQRRGCRHPPSARRRARRLMSSRGSA